MKTEEIKTLTEKYEDERFFKNDPIQIVKRYSDPKDIEIAAMICSTLAFGKRSEIYKACEKTMALMGDSPYEYIISGDALKYQQNMVMTNCWYRMLTMMNFAVICLYLKQIYTTFSSIEVLLLNSKDYIDTLTNVFYGCKGIPKNNKSCCKRLALMLRWLVRKDSKVDIGIWKNLDKSKLLLPLDVHSLNTLRELGVITRKSNDMKTVIQATEWAKTIFPNDPTKLDFFLFGYSYEQAHPKEFGEQEEKLTSMDLLTAAIYITLYLNDNTVNLIKEIGYHLDDKDKESRRIYGALSRRVNRYLKDINTLVGEHNMEFYAEFCTQMDEMYDPKINDLKQAICEVYTDAGYKDAKYLSLVEIARLMSEYVCKVNDKMICDLMKITDKAKCLRAYKLEEFHNIMENFSTWVYRKCHDLDMNKFDNVLNKFHVIDEAVSDINNTLRCINKANEYIGE